MAEIKPHKPGGNQPPHNMGIHMRYRIEEMVRAKRTVAEIARATGFFDTPHG